MADIRLAEAVASRLDADLLRDPLLKAVDRQEARPGEAPPGGWVQGLPPYSAQVAVSRGESCVLVAVSFESGGLALEVLRAVKDDAVLLDRVARIAVAVARSAGAWEIQLRAAAEGRNEALVQTLRCQLAFYA